MTLYQILLGTQYASIALMIFMCAYITKRWNKPLHGWLFFYCMATLINNAGYLALMLARSEEAAILAQQICYLGRVWIPFSIFQFVLILCEKKRPIWLLNLLAIFHAATYFLVLFMQHNSLYYASFSFTTEGLFPHITHTNGIWHFVYDAAILSYIVIGLVCLFQKIRTQKNPLKKKQLVFIVAVIFVDAAFFITQLFTPISGYDFTVIGYTLATIFLYIAIFRYDMLDSRELARDFVIEHVSEGVVAVNEDGTISFTNEKAHALFPSLSSAPEKVLAELQKLVKTGTPLVVGEKKYTAKENILSEHKDCPTCKKHGAGKVFVLTDDTAHYERAEKLTREMMLALSKTVDAKDHYTNGHSERVAKYAKEIARRIGKSAEEQEKIYEMGLLHDIGKIGVSEEIINKTSRLTDEEFAQIKKHTEIGSTILRQITVMPELEKGARNHHERYDGRGYPDGLSGEQIPEAARIICVADCYDAMTSTRTYSTPKPQEVVRAEIVRCKGSQFDPQIAEIMLSMIDDDKNYTMHE